MEWQHTCQGQIIIAGQDSVPPVRWCSQPGLQGVDHFGPHDGEVCRESVVLFLVFQLHSGLQAGHRNPPPHHLIHCLYLNPSSAKINQHQNNIVPTILGRQRQEQEMLAELQRLHRALISSSFFNLIYSDNIKLISVRDTYFICFIYALTQIFSSQFQCFILYYNTKEVIFRIFLTEWDPLENSAYGLSNENKTATRTSEGLTHVLYSNIPSFHPGNMLTVKVLDDADKSPGDGLCISLHNKNKDAFGQEGVVYVNLYGELFINMNE